MSDFKVFILLLVFAGTTKAQLIEPDYHKLNDALRTLTGCLSLVPSKDRNLGCVDSLRQLYDYCIPKRLSYFYIKQRRIDVYRLAKYCPAVDGSFSHMTSLFELDGQACVKGYENLAARLKSYHKNAAVTYIEEPFNHDFEKTSCKEFRKYVNFCVYVDGDLKKREIDVNQRLPELSKYIQNPPCPADSEDDVGFGVGKIDEILHLSGKKSGDNAFNNAVKLIQARGKRSISSADDNYCDQVRRGYINLGCQKWENVSDEDPIYYDQESWDKLRKQRANKSAQGAK